MVCGECKRKRPHYFADLCLDCTMQFFSNNDFKEINFDKYIVIKRDDIIKYCTNFEINLIIRILNKINEERKKIKKKTNKYIVINTDELYIGEILEVLK